MSTSASVTSPIRFAVRAAKSRLRWVSITALGGPVVPLV